MNETTTWSKETEAEFYHRKHMEVAKELRASKAELNRMRSFVRSACSAIR